MSRKHCHGPFGKENKMAKKVIVLFSMVCVVACCGAQSNQNENAQEISREQDLPEETRGSSRLLNRIFGTHY
jgi:hypothetical protein